MQYTALLPILLIVLLFWYAAHLWRRLQKDICAQLGAISLLLTPAKTPEEAHGQDA